jgi:c-di-GMP-binding flagellar brake protein YcgR
MRELRKFHRVESSEEIELVCCGRTYRGYLVNLSLNGALVNLEDEIVVSPGDSCLLIISIRGELQAIELWAEAVHGSETMVGMKFVGCDERASSRLLVLMERMTSQPTKLRDELERIQGYLNDFHGAAQ